MEELDEFDNIIMAENRFVDEGYKQGFDKGLVRGRIEGIEFGISKGVEIGSEIGFYLGFSTIIKEIQSNSLDNTSNSRIITTCSNLNELWSTVSNNSCNNLNVIVDELPKIKSKFRQLCSLLKLDQDVNFSKSEISF